MTKIKFYCPHGRHVIWQMFSLAIKSICSFLTRFASDSKMRPRSWWLYKVMQVTITWDTLCRNKHATFWSLLWQWSYVTIRTSHRLDMLIMELHKIIFPYLCQIFKIIIRTEEDIKEIPVLCLLRSKAYYNIYINVVHYVYFCLYSLIYTQNFLKFI